MVMADIVKLSLLASGELGEEGKLDSTPREVLSLISNE